MTEPDFELIMMKSEKTLKIKSENMNKKKPESPNYHNKTKWYKFKIGSGWYEVSDDT